MTTIARAIRDLPRQLSEIGRSWHPVSVNSSSGEFSFVAEPDLSREAICAEPGIICRIAITNHSLEVARDCELALVSCSLHIPGLTTPVVLPVREGSSRTKTDINCGEAKYFDLFGAFLNPSIDWPERTFVWAPNCPYVPVMSLTRGAALFSLTGSNFHPQFWNGSISVDQGDVRLTSLLPVANKHSQ